MVARDPHAKLSPITSQLANASAARTFALVAYRQPPPARPTREKIWALIATVSDSKAFWRLRNNEISRACLINEQQL